MTTVLLLDTCVCLWIVAGELTKPAEVALDDAYRTGMPVYVSPITALEIGTLARKGRFRSRLAPQKWFETVMGKPGAVLAEMPPELLIESALLPGDLHGDPYDRVIAATARAYGYTVLTRDAALLDYAADGHLSALEC